MRMRGLLFAVVALACLSCSVDPKPAPSPAATLSNVAEPALAPPTQAVTPTPTPTPSPSPQSSANTNEATRDPFAPPAVVAVSPPRLRDDVPRKARKYSLDQLKLVAIVSGEESRAMLIDPKGKGWIVTRGDHVGRPELLSDHVAGWRVQRIKTEEIIFVRDDLTQSEGTQETRVVALHTTQTADDLNDTDD